MEQPRILIIDDEEAARYGIARALAHQGYCLEEAPDGLKALEQINVIRPDVIVSDINMPGMDGLTLLRTLRTDAFPPLVILITAYGSEGVAIQALRSGAYDYLSKPFEVDELRAVVARAVDRQRLQRELSASRIALMQAEKMAALGRLVAGVAHEINNPLGALQSSTDLIARGSAKIQQQAPEELKRAADALRAAAETAGHACARISAVVGNLRRFARLDRADSAQSTIRECVESAIAMLPNVEDISIQTRLEKNPSLECRPRDLNQLFFNMLLNAQEAIQQTQRPGIIQVSADRQDASIIIVIEDTGSGVEPANRTRIFDPGFTTKGVGVGTGLGLPVCVRIAQEHGGRVELAESSPAGSRFRVILPLE